MLMSTGVILGGNGIHLDCVLLGLISVFIAVSAGRPRHIDGELGFGSE